MILKPVSVVLIGVLEADENELPISDGDHSKLLAHIPEGEETYLTIRDNLYTEWIHVQNQCGVLAIARGAGGSQARKFPRGSCVFFETSVPVIQWLICNYDCCNPDCVCKGVATTRSTLPTAVVGEPWEGTVTFSGSEPMTFAVDGMPGWMNAELQDNAVRLYGTPSGGATTLNVSVAATNCQGQTTVAAQSRVVVAEVNNP